VKGSVFAIAVLGALLASALPDGSAWAQDGVQSGLPEGEGREEVEIYCSACHSLKLVTQQGLSRRDWDELLVWMVDEQGMDELPPEDRKRVLDYLATHISIERVRKLRKGR